MNGEAHTTNLLLAECGHLNSLAIHVVKESRRIHRYAEKIETMFDARRDVIGFVCYIRNVICIRFSASSRCDCSL